MVITSPPALLGLCLQAGSSPAWPGWDTLREAYRCGDYAALVRDLMTMGEQDDMVAQALLGNLYQEGWCITQDLVEAEHWYTRAGEQGLAEAQSALGRLCLGMKGKSQDYKKAARWFRKAAEQGLAEAQFNLGLRYEQGQGVQQDHSSAMKWYRKAAEQGYAKAQNNLGGMYARGHGKPQDFIQAHLWYNLAGASGHDLGVKNRDILAQEMTPAQIAEAQKLADRWIKKHQKS